MTILILFLISGLAATISGIAGFGGALLLLPIISNFIGIKTAISVITIAQLFGNASRVWFGRKQLQWKPIFWFLLGALPFSILGSRMLVIAVSGLMFKGIGVLLILMVIYRHSGFKLFTTKNSFLLVGGGVATGFLSGIAGSAGSLGAGCFAGLNLSPIAYISSEAVTALSMHIAKIITYQKYALIGTRELYYGLVCGVAMIFGSYIGQKIIAKINISKFRLLIDILFILSGLQMIFLKL